MPNDLKSPPVAKTSVAKPLESKTQGQSILKPSTKPSAGELDTAMSSDRGDHVRKNLDTPLEATSGMTGKIIADVSKCETNVSTLNRQCRIPTEFFRMLKEKWGFDSLRMSQQQAIDSIIAGRDTLVVMPTGGGKSLCYQAPGFSRRSHDRCLATDRIDERSSRRAVPTRDPCSTNR